MSKTFVFPPFDDGNIEQLHKALRDICNGVNSDVGVQCGGVHCNDCILEHSRDSGDKERREMLAQVWQTLTKITGGDKK